MILNLLHALILFLATTASSPLFSQLWVDPSQTTLGRSRQYISIQNEEGSIQLQVFNQNKGDYPTVKTQFPFKDLLSAKNYIAKKYPQFREIETLHEWPIGLEAEGIKGLFGRDKGHSEIWTASNRWDLEWESKFASWLKTDVDEDFFIRYKIATDCADAVIGLRWIFARIHSLPAANYLVHTNYLFGNFSMRKEWRKLPKSKEWHKDRLFLTALDYVMNMTNTKSLPKDSYHVSIDKNGLVPGAFILTQNNIGGHVKIISEVNYTDISEMPIYTLSSTVPRELRVLVKEVFMDQDWPVAQDKEIMAFRWPEIKNGQWHLKEASNHTNYSKEQFDLDIKEKWPVFIQYVMSKVKEIYEPSALVDLVISDLKNYLEQRISIVERGSKFCSLNDCINNAKNYDDWSTPSRDSKLTKKFTDADNLIAEYSKSAPTLYKKWLSRLKGEYVEVEGHRLNLHGIKFIFENNLYSSDPSKNILGRWGLDISVYVEKKLERVKALLIQRNDIISNEDKCAGDECYPKTNLWVGRGTYHIDSELVREYVDFANYCYYLSESLCNDALMILGEEKLTFFFQTRKITDWFQDVIKFNSDPRATLERKWGQDKKINIVDLKYFENLKISQNKLALLDEYRIIDLKNNKEVFSSKRGVLYLTNKGDVYKYDDIKEEIFYVDSLYELKKVALKPNKENENHLSFIEGKNHLYLKHESTLTKSLYKLEKNEITLIADNYKKINVIGEYVIVFHSDRVEIINGELRHFLSYKDFGVRDLFSLEILAQNNESLLLNYSDRDNDLYKTFIYDLRQSSFLEITSDINNRQLLKWFDLDSKIAVFETHYNDEYPNVFFVNWKQEVLETKKIGNIFLGSKKYKDKIILAVAKGSQWSSQDRQNKMYSFADGNLSIFSFDQLFFEQVTDKGIYLTNHHQSFLLLENNDLFGILPKKVTTNEYCKSVVNSHRGRFDYRFSSSYGDFHCMGGIADLLVKDAVYIVPLITTYSWASYQKKEDRAWLEQVDSFKILTGTLISIGKNSAIWME